MAILWFLLSILFILLALGYVFSILMTRRHTPDETRSPAEYGLALDEVAFPARDGLTLRGWWIPAAPAPTLPRLALGEAASDRAAIFLHGHGGSMDPDVQYVPAL